MVMIDMYRLFDVLHVKAVCCGARFGMLYDQENVVFDHVVSSMAGEALLWYDMPRHFSARSFFKGEVETFLAI